MSAAEVLTRMLAAGFRLDADGEKLVVTPASRLTEALRTELRQSKPELLALLKGNSTQDFANGVVSRETAPGATQDRRYRLTLADADRCHTPCWDDAEIGRFVTRVALFMRRGVEAGDADDLAEFLVLRDRDAKPDRLCLECQHYRAHRCGNHRAAGLASDEVSAEVAALVRLCPGFTQ